MVMLQSHMWWEIVFRGEELDARNDGVSSYSVIRH